MELRSSICFFVLIASTVSITTARAADFHSPRSTALAGSGHAGPLLNDAIMLNPSFASFLPTYAIGFSWMNFSGPGLTNTSDGYRGRNYSVSLQDGRSELFQAGAAFTQREDLSLLHLGASKALLKQLGLGIGGKYYRVSSTRATSWDLNASSTVVVSDWLQAAAIADNLLQTEDGKARGMWREYTLGIKVNIQKMVLLYADPHLAEKPEGGMQSGYEVGVELAALKDFFLRFGAMKNSLIPFEEARGRGFGAGVGWIAPRLSLDFGMGRIIEPHQATTYTGGATVYF